MQLVLGTVLRNPTVENKVRMRIANVSDNKKTTAAERNCFFNVIHVLVNKIRGVLTSREHFRQCRFCFGLPSDQT